MMETYTVRNPNPGSPAGVYRGIFSTDRTRISLGGIDGGPAGATHIPLSLNLQNALPEDLHIAAASVMRSSTDLKFIAVEKAENENAGAALVLINVAPPEGKTLVITNTEINTHNCHGRGNTSVDPTVCQDCGKEYVKLTEDASVFTHPQSGHISYYRPHLCHRVKFVGEGSHIVARDMTHREMLVIMEPGARIRLATMDGNKTVAEQILVRTHTELSFAPAGNIYLASELSEEHAAYLK